MHPAYLNQLPDWVVELVNHTEAASGLPVDVIVAPDRIRAGEDAPGLLACVPGATYARILTPVEGHFPHDAVVHELLHLRRQLVHGVPRLALSEAHQDDWSPAIDTAIARNDNFLEHLVIVPNELGYVPQRRAFWERRIERSWRRLNALHDWMADDTILALSIWVLMRHVLPHSAWTQLGHEVMGARNLMDRANAALHSMVPVLNNKPALAAAWFHAAGLPAGWIDLEYLTPPGSHTEPLVN